MSDARFGWSESRPESFKQAGEFARKTLALDDSNPLAYALLGRMRTFQRQYDQAIAYGEKAVALNPNNADMTASLALTLVYSGKPEDAIHLLKKAMRLSPFYPALYLLFLGDGYLLAGRHEDAISAFKGLLDRNEHRAIAHRGLAAGYSKLGRIEEARTHATELLKVRPEFSLGSWATSQPYKDAADLERLLDGLREAGLK